MSRPTIHHGDVLDWAAAYEGELYHALLCDPPYGLEFMGKSWDSGIAFRPETWAAFLPLLYPGAFCMAFAGSRGWHRMAVAIEDAGYLILPTIFCWATGQSFPKATNLHMPLLRSAFDASVQDAVRSIGTTPDSQSGYPAHCRSCGGRLQTLEVAFRDGAPSPTDARTHSHYGGPSVEIQVDSEQICIPTGKVFFRPSSRDYYDQASLVEQAASSPASIGCGPLQASLPDTPDLANAGEMLQQLDTHASNTLFPHEHAPHAAQPSYHTQYRQPLSGASSLPETQSYNRASKNDLPPAVSPLHDETASGTYRTRTSGKEDRCIPSLTLAPASQELLDSLIYTHYTIGCISCQHKFYTDAIAFSGHRYGGQVLKNAVEPIIVFQKPYGGRPVDVMTATGAGALNIDAGRIPGEPWQAHRATGLASVKFFTEGEAKEIDKVPHDGGRWPANLVLSHLPECEPIGERRVRGTGGGWNGLGEDGKRLIYGDKGWNPDGINRQAADGYETITDWRCVEGCAVAALGRQSGESSTPQTVTRGVGNLWSNGGGGLNTLDRDVPSYGDTGTAARFFYNASWQAERLEAADTVIYRAKASTAEREAGLEDKRPAGYTYAAYKEAIEDGRELRRNVHPTIKPIALGEHLARLLLPPTLYAPRRLLVPFAGAGSECIGAMRAGWEHIDGVELEEDHVSIARSRIEYWAERGVQLQLSLFDEVA